MRNMFLILWILSLLISNSLFAQSGETVTKDQKLGNGKDFGVAINPVGFLFSWYSGEVNIWKLDRTAEINIPFLYASNPFDIGGDNSDLSIFSIGAQYRKFFSDEQSGFFVQGGLIYYTASVEGKGLSSGESISGTQNSVLFGVGYRMISESNGLFWAIAVSAGKSWGVVKDIDGEEISGDGLTWDIDLFKMGYAW